MCTYYSCSWNFQEKTCKTSKHQNIHQKDSQANKVLVSNDKYPVLLIINILFKYGSLLPSEKYSPIWVQFYLLLLQASVGMVTWRMFVCGEQEIFEVP